MFGGTLFPTVSADAPMMVTLGPHGFYWFALREKVGAPRYSEALPALPAFKGWTTEFKAALTARVLPGYLPRCAWFQPAGQVVRDFRLAHIAELMPAVWLVIVEVSFREGQPESFLLPLAQVDAEAEATLVAEHPEAVLARIDGGGVLADALFLPHVRERWLRLHLEPDAALDLSAREIAALDPEVAERCANQSRLVEVDHQNTSIAFGDTLLLKVYRCFEPGTQSEVELLEALQRREFSRAAPIYGALSMRCGAGRAMVSSLTGHLVHQGTGWTFALDALSRYFDRALESRLDPMTAEVSDVIGGVLPDRVRSLAQGIADLHKALASEHEAAFAPEPFGSLHQRSLYQAMRGQAGRVLRLLRTEASRFNEADQLLAAHVLNERPAILKIFSAMLSQHFATSKTRIHGDLHLGQIVNTGKEFVFTGFDGEAGRSLGEKALKRSPLVDVASMLRSLDYVAAAALRNESESDREMLGMWAAMWVRKMAEVLTAEYFAAAGDSFLPASAAGRETLLKMFVLDRALHELGYELTHRSKSVNVPLRAIAELVAGF
jgi:maltose alpha-D-glucosyltransferase/alpha-amylase